VVCKKLRFLFSDKLLGDGGCDEGQVWEAFMFAAHNKLDNLVAIIDVNGYQVDGRTSEILGIEPLDKKLKTFNWEVFNVDGHNIELIISTINNVISRKNKKPKTILPKTVKAHIMSMRTAMISFGSPEQGLTAAAITQLARSYGFPVYNNTGMTDSKIPDAQPGFEKAATLMFGILSGCDIFGHLGISGADNAANLTQLIIDDETAGYIKRMMGSFEVNDETVSLADIKETGIGGNFLMNDKTLRDFKKEIWYPNIFDRFAWDRWEEKREKSTIDLALEIEEDISLNHKQCFLEDSMRKECKKVIEYFKKELNLS